MLGSFSVGLLVGGTLAAFSVCKAILLDAFVSFLSFNAGYQISEEVLLSLGIISARARCCSFSTGWSELGFFTTSGLAR